MRGARNSFPGNIEKRQRSASALGVVDELQRQAAEEAHQEDAQHQNADVHPAVFVVQVERVTHVRPHRDDLRPPVDGLLDEGRAVAGVCRVALRCLAIELGAE
eukprot:EG_transcript_28931